MTTTTRPARSARTSAANSTSVATLCGSSGSVTTETQDRTRAARLFPLVARSGPACPSLSRRIDDVAEKARAARAADDAAEALTAATRALNLAAVIADDCGEHRLAYGVCRRHIDVYASQARALTVVEATRMLGPAIKLARIGPQQGSDQDPGSVVTALGLLLRATRDQAPLRIAGLTLPLGNVHGTLDERRRMVNLVRTHLLVTAIAGMAEAGRWSEAAGVARAYGGVGLRLLEGRQAVILDCAVAGELPTARRLIADSAPRQAWERGVVACLTALCAEPELRHEAVMAMSDQYRMSGYGTTSASEAGGGDGDAQFRARHGLVVATIACADADLAVRRAGEEVAAQVVARALESLDGYAARDVLRHKVTSRVAAYQDHTTLARIVERSGLAGGTLIDKTRTRLTNAVKQAIDALRQAL
jgi:hypothetical protein